MEQHCLDDDAVSERLTSGTAFATLNAGTVHSGTVEPRFLIFQAFTQWEGGV
jgi:hypothetical protein